MLVPELIEVWLKASVSLLRFRPNSGEEVIWFTREYVLLGCGDDDVSSVTCEFWGLHTNVVLVTQQDEELDLSMFRASSAASLLLLLLRQLTCCGGSSVNVARVVELVLNVFEGDTNLGLLFTSVFELLTSTPFLFVDLFCCCTDRFVGPTKFDCDLIKCLSPFAVLTATDLKLL